MDAKGDEEEDQAESKEIKNDSSGEPAEMPLYHTKMNGRTLNSNAVEYLVGTGRFARLPVFVIGFQALAVWHLATGAVSSFKHESMFCM